MSRAQAATATVAPLTAASSRPSRPRRGVAARRGPQGPRKAKIDPQMAAAFIEILREQRVEASSELAESLETQGADATVCAFLGDDLREVAHSLADVEAWVQCTLDVLDRPSPSTLFEQAAEVGVLNDLEHLFQTVDNLRRRLMQASVGLR